MAVKNKLKEVLETLLGEGITAYQFKKITKLGQTTCLNALNNPDWYPDKSTTERICQIFGIQPGDFIVYVEDKHISE